MVPFRERESGVGSRESGVVSREWGCYRRTALPPSNPEPLRTLFSYFPQPFPIFFVSRATT